MESILACLPRGSRAAVIRLRSLGDCVLTTPALHLLKQHRPDLRLAVVVEDRFRAVFEGNPDIDELLPAEIGALRAFRPRLCLNLHGGTRSAWMTVLSGARYRAGFAHFGFSFVYNVRIPRAQEVLGEERTVHTAEHLASAMFFLGVPAAGIPRARLLADGRQEGAAYAVIHPAASAPDKTWPAGRFVEVARHLRSTGLDPVIIGGPGDDLSAFSEFRTVAGAPLEEVKSLLAGAALFCGNDSGPAHMAAAFGVPVVVLFGRSDPVVWAPWRTQSEVLTSAEGIAAIPAERAIAALDRLRVHA